MNEIVVNEYTLHRKRTWIVVEIISRVIKLVKKSKKFNFLLVYTKNDIITYYIVEKNYIQILFEWFLKQKILSQCNVFSKSRFVLIMNNVSIYYHRNVKLLYVKTNVKFIYFSFYSFDFNSIEKFFSILKIWLKQHYENVNVIENNIKNVLYLAINVCNNEKMIKKHFEHVNIRLIVFSIFDQKFELDSIFLTCLDHKLVVLSLVLHNFIKSISKSISWRLETISLVDIKIN